MQAADVTKTLCISSLLLTCNAAFPRAVDDDGAIGVHKACQ